jgi:hypothetical protein
MWKPKVAFLATYPLEPTWPRLRRAIEMVAGVGLLVGGFHLASPVGLPSVLLGFFVPLLTAYLIWNGWCDRAERRRLLILLDLPRPAESGIWAPADLATSSHLRLRLAEARPDPAWQIGQDATHVFLLAPDGSRWKTLMRRRR